MWKYKKAVIPYIQKHPEQFILVNKGCHEIIEKNHRLAKTSMTGFYSMIIATLNTKT